MSSRITITARFVGGPWHNRVEEVVCAPRVIVRKINPLWTFASGIGGGTGHEYFLAEYTSEYFDTVYYQYVHRTLIDSVSAHPCTYKENISRGWKISPSEIDAKLAKAIGDYRHN